MANRAVATEESQLKLVVAGLHAMREKSRAELEWTEEFGQKATEPIPTANPAESPAKFPPFDPSEMESPYTPLPRTIQRLWWNGGKKKNTTRIPCKGSCTAKGATRSWTVLSSSRTTGSAYSLILIQVR
jgi:hypothetical protein